MNPQTTVAPNLIKGMRADFVPAEYPGRNTSGFVVYGKNVLVRMDECSPTTAGGILLPEEQVEKMSAGAETGCIYALGPEAFRLFDDGTVWSGPKPKVGDRIYVEKWSGMLARGRDNAVYRMMDYRCVAGGLDPNPVDEE